MNYLNIKVEGDFMFIRENLKAFFAGIITYFVVSIILELLNIRNLVIEVVIFVIIVLILLIATKKSKKS